MGARCHVLPWLIGFSGGCSSLSLTAVVAEGPGTRRCPFPALCSRFLIAVEKRKEKTRSKMPHFISYYLILARPFISIDSQQRHSHAKIEYVMICVTGQTGRSWRQFNVAIFWIRLV